MHNCKSGSYLLLTVIAAFALISAASIAAAQNNDRPWMNPSLSPEGRANLVLKQLTLDEKLALLHGNGMPTRRSANASRPANLLGDGGRRSSSMMTRPRSSFRTAHARAYGPDFPLVAARAL